MSSSTQRLSYEADLNGNVYERDSEDGSVWPTGIRFRAWAGRSDITRDEFVGRLHQINRSEA